MTTSTHNFGWNGISDPKKAEAENARMTKRVNRVLAKIGQPPVSFTGSSSLEITYDIDKNKNISIIVLKLRQSKALNQSINKTIDELVEYLKPEE